MSCTCRAVPWRTFVRGLAQVHQLDGSSTSPLALSATTQFRQALELRPVGGVRQTTWGERQVRCLQGSAYRGSEATAAAESHVEGKTSVSESAASTEGNRSSGQREEQRHYSGKHRDLKQGTPPEQFVGEITNPGDERLNELPEDAIPWKARSSESFAERDAPIKDGPTTRAKPWQMDRTGDRSGRGGRSGNRYGSEGRSFRQRDQRDARSRPEWKPRHRSEAGSSRSSEGESLDQAPEEDGSRWQPRKGWDYREDENTPTIDEKNPAFKGFQSGKKLQPWQIQKAALKAKFPEGWRPMKRLSPDALSGIRALNAQFPDIYTTSALANRFEVSPEAIRRILKSNWKANEDEERGREDRWFRRGKQIWEQKAALGVKPPKRWRAEGIARDPSYHEWSKRASQKEREWEEEEIRKYAAYRERMKQRQSGGGGGGGGEEGSSHKE